MELRGCGVFDESSQTANASDQGLALPLMVTMSQRSFPHESEIATAKARGYCDVASASSRFEESKCRSATLQGECEQ